MQKNQSPNVIVFFTDQQRHDTTGVHGNPLDLTPNFDYMAKSGTHIEKSFTCQPVCAPARSSLQTGLYATNSGCYKNGIPLSKDKKTLAHYFKDAGYQTGYIGKWHLGGEEPVTEPNRGGYDYWLGSELLEFSSDAYDTVLFNNDNEEVKLPGYRVDAMADAAIRYIDDHKKDPFFMFLSFLEPHHQNHTDNYPAPNIDRDKYIGSWTPPDLESLSGTSPQHLPGYYGMVKRLDAALGRVMDSLESLNLAKDTIILFTSDHGNHFKTRNGEYKRSPHDSSIRVPTAFCGSIFNGGGTIDKLVSLVDLPPTLLDACGITVPEQMEGHSIVPLVQREKIDWSEEVFVQISESQIGRAIRTDRWKYAVSAKGKEGTEAPSSDTYEEIFLYDLDADPYELTNLVGVQAYRSIADQLKDRMLKYINRIEGESPIIHDAPSRESRQRRATKQEIFDDHWNGLVVE
ncbi:sulfatase-like hydrolase/transferase [Paraliobacillus salinarum]|uniref:sulfatase-like hydrolase/transferase n=1 Tax=Paraliobacillus salinarum TaxID=1158996 RepID=UPI0015F39200|nr:sulfatase-like hydrolase/transferase [Paraliobacillus salinarum]